MRFFSFLLLLLVPAFGVAGQQECISEPVFGGNACIYTEGPTDRPALILVHGIKGEGLRDWRPVIDAMSDRYRIITFDLPGFGASSKDSNAYSPANYVRFVRFVAEREGLERFHLVGHSMGGAIALLYAATYPEDVERLVIASVAGILHRLTMARYLVGGWWGRLLGENRISGAGARMAGKVLEEFEGLADHVETWAGAELAGTAEAHEPALTAALGLARQPYGALLDRVSAPTLILWGEDDAIAPVRTSHALMFQLPAAERVTLPGAGHMLMHDAPDRFVQLLTDFVERPSAGLPRIRQRMVSQPPPANGRIGQCQGKRNVRFTGEYERIELVNCDAVVIENARVGQLVARESRAQVLDSVIVSRTEAVRAWGSDLEFTASVIEGAIAFDASGSRLDVVGCDVVATDALARAERASNLVFSITRAQAPGTPAVLHEFREVAPGEGR